MLSFKWTPVCSAEIGCRVPFLVSNIWDNPWAPQSMLQIHFSPKIVAISGGGSEGKGKLSGDFAGLSALKEELESQAQARSSLGSGGFAGLSALKERIKSGKRASPEPPSLEGQKTATNDSSEENGQGPVNLIVSNLPSELTRAEYESFMQRIPEISNWRYLSHKSGRCRGYGFCEVRPGADVAAVIQFVGSQTLGGRILEASLATGKKEPNKDPEQEDVRSKSVREKPKAGASVQQKARPTSFGTEAKCKPTGKNLKVTLDLKNEGRPGPDVQQQQFVSFASSDGNGSRKTSKNFLRQRDEGGMEALESQQQLSAMATTSPERYGRLSGQAVLAALERFSRAGRARQRRAKGGPARSKSSEPENDTENREELQLVEFTLDWAPRIQSLEASIEELKRS